MLKYAPYSIISLRLGRAICVAISTFLALSLWFQRQAHPAANRAALSTSAPCPDVIPDADFTPLAIRCRIRTAQDRIRSAARSQSSSPEEAVAEYKRRYRKDPPQGFRDWVQFALDHGSKIIDDFDQIHQDLEPYRTADAQRVFRSLRAQDAEELPHTTRITIQNGTMSTTTGYMYDEGLRTLVRPFLHKLPNGLLFLSTIDEPRILNSQEPAPATIQFRDRAGESIEDLVLTSCRQIPPRLAGRLDPVRNVCESAHPANLHAFVASPSTFSYTHSPMPMLSFGRMAAFRDILVPCPCYTWHPLAAEDPIPFAEKRRAVYWRGSTTGGRATRFSWRSGHRQRFVAFVQSLQSTAITLAASRFFGVGSERLDTRRIETFKNAFDVHVGEYKQCDEDVCKDMERVMGPPDQEPEDTSSDYQYLFDLDGNSMSTRFYRLLSRQSVVLKQTWFNEWHDDRLVPWAHYIPVTMGMEELPALISFLMNDPEGEVLSAAIAESGSARAREALREIDMSIYLYRLFLEMAELHGTNQTVSTGHGPTRVNDTGRRPV
ncbi:glycosyltransferase family 90 protein [Cordyceps javanica]|uniref:Glycosyltransferase family 90 protein n=1 Tax=Cordyceps javanica TaxID=43265 RepID=A0A545VH40_9HYPO|nr:glycosyltransferase family 90 protein [Cordyceps javanica]TQW12212.1 glycosyltransferase family 90 protein [Cordyceps javanica]